MIKCLFDILDVGAKARTRLQSEAVSHKSKENLLAAHPG